MNKRLAFARRYVLPWAPWYAVGTVALFATNALSVAIPLEVASAVDALSVPGGSASIPGHALRVMLMGLVVIAVRTVSRVAFFDPGRNIEAIVKHDLFERLLRQQPPFLARHAPGDLVSRSSADLNNIRLLVGFGLLQAINTVAAVGLAGAQMLRMSPTLAVATLIPIGLAMALNNLSIKRFYDIVRDIQAALSDISDHVLSTYQGIGTVQAFAAEDAFQARFDTQNQAYANAAQRRANLRVVLGPALALAASIDVFLLLWIGSPRVLAHELTVGELVAWITLIGMLINPLRGVSFLAQIWKQAEVALDRLGEVMDPEPDRPDLPNPAPPPALPPVLELRSLTFGWPGAAAPALSDVSLRVGAGQTLGVFGATGAGKTTLLRCIARLHNPPPGTVFVDGVDVRALDLDAWRRRIAFVPQRAWLFSETLADNVLLGGPDDGRLERILATVTLDADVAHLPQGTASVVGESGIMLSGGQRQRVALARGLLRTEACVLVLDDVLSAVDATTERTLVDALQAAVRRPTTVLVSHRVSALQHADNIVVLDHGRVVDQGTHASLSSRPGIYRDTLHLQQDHDLPAAS